MAIRFYIAGLAGIILACLSFAGGGDGGIPALIKKLGSPNFKERAFATASLKSRPDALAALKQAASFGDPEIRQRASEIVTYLERKPIRDLEELFKSGKVDLAIEKSLQLVPHMYDAEIRNVYADFASTLAELHSKRGGEKLKKHWTTFFDPAFVRVDRVTENYQADRKKSYLVLAREIDLDPRRRKKTDSPANSLEHNALFISTGKITLLPGHRHLLIAGGDIKILGPSDSVTDSIIVSAANVVVNCDLGNSLIVAKGSIQCNQDVVACQLIAGTTVTTARKPERSILTEKERNPLGFIRWVESNSHK
ncbi:MAG TPA: hypothetical protein VFE62_26780 [Gemmataceae bacterium]|nr:hypothetical protein [Gemmataceae bacterium]